ncbi:phage major capsid protein [Aerococcaceae bacterium zg-ZUI334]|uniref:phage major capsid protein n=1 Tax=Aerococcaceae bacterium zg-252 TaxID=2796928 RepID=UPI001B929868|nr:phage major capsid protein [Aerococcaceae bacterium zg-ZUI334]MBS4462851.1 phage major capsid protein [Aerococcaceae bacterium zg-B36]
MNLKELREMFSQKTKEFDAIKAEGDMEEVRAKFSELKELKDRIAILEEERSLKLPTFTDEPDVRKVDKEVEVRDLSEDELDKAYEGVFLRAFRGRKLSERDMDVYDRVKELRDAPSVTPHLKTATDEDGGFIVPKSVSTLIQTYKRELEFDLTQIVDVQRTAVISGEFTFEKLGAMTPFAKLSQWDNIEEVATPQFERKKFTVEDYAGILPIPRTLLQDTDQNLLAYIAKFIARKTVVTRNAEILKVLKDTYTTKKAVVTIDDVKDILNVTLDRAFLPSTMITTNQDGFNVLDKIKDKDGNYLLQPDPKDPTQKRLLGYLVRVLPNATLKSDTGKAPFIVGDLKEAIRFYDRGVYEITPTTIGGKAFERNSLDIRVIDRFGVVAMDKDAVVFGELTVS